MKVSMATTNLFFDPVFKDGAFTSNDRDVRRYALQKTMRAIDLGAELGRADVRLLGRPRGSGGRRRQARPRRARALPRGRGLPLRVRARPRLRHALRARAEAQRAARRHLPAHRRATRSPSSSGSTHPEMVGVNPEVAHETMAGLSFLHGVAQALWAGKLFHIDLNGQRIGRYDQDFRFGAVGLKDGLFLVKLLEDSGYDGVRHFDARPLRVEGEEGIWDFAAGCMRTYLALKETRRAHEASDAEIAAALEAAKVPELALDTIGPYSTDARRRAARRAARPRRPARRASAATSVSTSWWWTCCSACDEAGRPARRTPSQPQPGAGRGGAPGAEVAGHAGRGDRPEQEHGIQPGSRAVRVRAPPGVRPGALRQRWAARPRTSSSTRRGRSCSGLEINVDYLAVWATDLGGAVLHRVVHGQRQPRRAGERGRPARVARPASALDEDFARGRRPVASAVAVPGIVGQDGEVVVAPNLGWEDVPLRRDAQRRARPAHRGERGQPRCARRADRGRRPGTRATSSTCRRRWASARGSCCAASCSGSARLRRRDRASHDRSLRAALPVRRRAAASSGWRGRTPCYGWRVGTRACAARGRARSGPGAMLADSARAGHPKTLQALSQVGHTLGIAAAAWSTCSIPRRCCSAATSRPLTRWLREPIEAELHRRLLAGDGSGCRVIEARLSGEAAVRGAAAAARRRVLADPLRFESRPMTAGQAQ